MIEDPVEKVGEYVAAGADIITIHPEGCAHPHRALQQMRNMTNANDPARGLVRGVALNPGTPLAVLEPLLGELELIVLLAVNPGWKGQAFIPATVGRIAAAKQMIMNGGKEILLAVDGGIVRSNISEVAKASVDIIVTGSAVFDGKSPEENAKFMLSAVRPHAA
jgi:ribulose-phosphate 3-epimerase